MVVEKEGRSSGILQDGCLGSPGQKSAFLYKRVQSFKHLQLVLNPNQPSRMQEQRVSAQGRGSERAGTAPGICQGRAGEAALAKDRDKSRTVRGMEQRAGIGHCEGNGNLITIAWDIICSMTSVRA